MGAKQGRDVPTPGTSPWEGRSHAAWEAVIIQVRNIHLTSRNLLGDVPLVRPCVHYLEYDN